jgi:general secretion pathway protein A
MADAAIGRRGLGSPPVVLALGDVSSAPRPHHARFNSASILQSFGLTANPFSKSSVAGRLPLISATRQAVEQLVQAIEGRKGLLVLTGEVGTGKTTVLDQLRLWLADRSMPSAFLFNPLLDTRNFVDFILAEFGVKVEPGSAGNSFTQLSNWLFARYRDGATVVLIVDEAQTMPAAVLQALGSILNLESSGEKLLQVVLAGQPELNDTLRAPEFRTFRQRIALRCRIAPLSLEETRAYVQARLRAAGSNGQSVFSTEALNAVHFYSRGIPRVINLLCEHALANAGSQRMRQVAADMVDEVARELQLDDARPAPASLSDASMDATLRAMRGHSSAGEVVSASTASQSQTVDRNGPLAWETPKSEEPEGRAVTDAPIPQNVSAEHRPAATVAAAERPGRPGPPLSSSALSSHLDRVAKPPLTRSQFTARWHPVLARIAGSLRVAQASAKFQIQRDLRSASTLLKRRPSSSVSGRSYGLSLGKLSGAWACVLHWLNQPMRAARPPRS